MNRLKKIARITTQKRNKHRYNIFLTNGHEEDYGFSVDEDVLIQYNLRKGLELSESTIEQLLREDTLQKSYTQVIGYLSYRMRTKKEIIDYLEKKEVDHEHITKIMEKLTARKLIDDREFADSFVRSRIQTTTKGPALVKQELQAKGIAALIADEAIKQYDYDLQHKKASKIAEKRSKKSGRHSVKKQQQQLQATLLRNGFSQEVIQDVIAHTQKKYAHSEEEALSYQGEKLFRKHREKLSGYELKLKLKESLYRQGFNIDAINEFLDKKIDNM